MPDRRLATKETGAVMVFQTALPQLDACSNSQLPLDESKLIKEQEKLQLRLKEIQRQYWPSPTAFTWPCPISERATQVPISEHQKAHQHCLPVLRDAQLRTAINGCVQNKARMVLMHTSASLALFQARQASRGRCKPNGILRLSICCHAGEHYSKQMSLHSDCIQAV